LRRQLAPQLSAFSFSFFTPHPVRTLGNRLPDR
jgi:hypothetical protein